MSRVVYVNGAYQPWSAAQVHAEDRGFQFGDAVYEVCEVRDGRLIDETRHMDRLDRSLAELAIESPMSRPAWSRVLRETIRRNRVTDGSVYLQVSRGVARREFLFPKPGTKPTVVVIARPADRAKAEAKAQAGIAIVTRADPRWERCDIKTVMLLPASLAKEAARKEGAGEVWFTDDDGAVTEGGSSNAWIVTRDGVLVTRATSQALLGGITRLTLFDVVAREGLRLEQRAFTVAEALDAREAFVTSATSIVMPVVRIDGRPVGNGAPGSVSLRLREVFHEVAASSAT